MTQGPMDPMATTLVGLQRTIDIIEQYMVCPPQQQQPLVQKVKPHKQIINFKKLVPDIYDTTDDAYQFLDSWKQAGVVM